MPTPPDSKVAVASQAAQLIRGWIETGTYPVGSLLPSQPAR